MSQTKLKLIFGIILCILSIILLSCAIMRGFCKLKVTIVIFSLVLGYYVGDLIIQGTFEILYLFVKASILTQILNMLMSALLEGTVINICFDYVSGHAGEREWNGERLLLKSVPGFVVSGVCIVSILSIIPGTRPAARMINHVENRMESFARHLITEDLSTAVEEYDTVLDYINVLRYVSDIDYNDSRLRYAMEQKDLFFVKYLVWEKQGNFNEIKNYYDTVNNDINIGIPLLDYYCEVKKEAADKEIFERDYGESVKAIISQMMAENQFVNHTLSYKDIEKKGKYFEKKFEKYIASEEYLVMLEAMERINENGQIDGKDMEDILACANAHPDNLFVQFAAVSYGTSYKVDGGSHYGETAICINRIVDIFCPQEDVAGAEDKEVYLWAANRLIDIGCYENALKYIDMLMQTDKNEEENVLLAAFCYNKLGLTDQCIEIVSRLPEDNYYGTYYRALSLIQDKENDEALKEIVKLCDILESNADEKQEIGVLLHELAQKTVIYDNVPIHKYGFYDPESEEQLKIIGDNKLLKLYLDAMYYCYQDIQIEEAQKTIEQLLKIDNELMGVNFLAGISYLEAEKYDEALVYLEKVVETRPDHIAAWYTISYIYDKTGRYQKAYECCLKIKELVSSTDHQFDVYGIGYHNNQLLLQLEKELGVEK